MARDRLPTLYAEIGFATKQFRRNEDGKTEKISHNLGTRFSAVFSEVDSIVDLAERIEALQEVRNAFVIRGRLRRGADQFEAVRRIHEHADGVRPSFEQDTNGHHWVGLDIDGAQLSVPVDVVNNPERAVEQLTAEWLPELCEASIFWQLTSSQSVEPGAPLHARLWLWGERPYRDAELKQWALWVNEKASERLGRPVKILDPALYSPVQIHYTAAPIFHEPLPDPLPRRCGLRRGVADEVALVLPPEGWRPSAGRYNASAEAPERAASAEPEDDGRPLSAADRRRHVIEQLRRHERSQRAGGGFDWYLSQIGDGADGFDHAIYCAACSYFSNYREDADRAELKARLRERIRVAPAGDRSADTIARYCSDAYLDHKIDDAERAMRRAEAERRTKTEETAAEPKRSDAHEQADSPAEKLAETGIAVGASLCIKKGSAGKDGKPPTAEVKCPYFDGCPYQEQKRNIGPAMYFMSHEYMFIEMEGIPRPDFIVIDEQFYKSAKRGITNISMRRLDAPSYRKFNLNRNPDKPRVSDEELDNLREVRHGIAEIIRTGDLTPGRVGGGGITAAMLEQAATTERKRAEYSHIKPDMNETDQRNQLSKYLGQSRRSLAPGPDVRADGRRAAGRTHPFRQRSSAPQRDEGLRQGGRVRGPD
jgi:hypothetical protein